MANTTTEGNDVLTGGSGADTIYGGGGSDVINSGAGNDILDGGSGSDRLNGGSGNDRLVYKLFENANAADLYMGGSGIDTLQLELTSAEWANATVQQEIREYLQHLATVKVNASTGEVSNGTASDFTFDFGNGSKLTVSMMERLTVVVNGETIDPRAPYITSNGAGPNAAVSIAENTNAVTTVTAFDLNSTALTYSLVAGFGDNNLFTINQTTGVLSITGAPDFEMPADTDHNNVYNVRVQVSDGANVDTQTIAVTVTNVNDAPVTTPVTLVAIAEDSGVRVITQAQLLGNASDVDSASLTASALAIATGSGTLVDNANGSWNYTPALNDDTQVSFSYTVSDGSLTAAGSATLDITPVNDAATDLIFSFTGTPGNSLPTGNFGQMTQIDPDGGAGTYTFSLAGLTATTLAGGSVTDSGSTAFTGDLSVSATGVISATNLNEDRVYEMSVQVAQGTATFSETFSVITGTNSGTDNINGAYATGDDVIFARGGGDTILAGSGNDTVFGQAADDQIHGETGNDVLTGGGGNDTFYFDTALGVSANVDTITDFNANTGDKIALDQTIFTMLTVASPLASANFVANAGGVAADANDYVLYDTGTGNLYYDADGSGAGAKLLFATLTLSGVSGSVDNTDFTVVP